MPSTLNINYSNSSSTFHLDASFSELLNLAPVRSSFIITDENVYEHYQTILKPWKVIRIPAGESSKSLRTVEQIIAELIAREADRDALIIGMGGGVVTDISGFVAGIYKRGVRCAFVPTTILSMVDAAIGGKNGLDFGNFKNMVGLIRQPEFLLYDYHLLNTLPYEEWVNGFAEIIKHACILDADMFSHLEANSLEIFQNDHLILAKLIYDNVALKTRIVQEDEFEQGKRKILNFGHTFGHAIETPYKLTHGHAVSIGMNMAARISTLFTGFQEQERLDRLIAKYKLPYKIIYDRISTLEFMLQDKKRNAEEVNYILLKRIGEAIIQPISFEKLKSII